MGMYSHISIEHDVFDDKNSKIAARVLASKAKELNDAGYGDLRVDEGFLELEDYYRKNYETDDLALVLREVSKATSQSVTVRVWDDEPNEFDYKMIIEGDTIREYEGVIEYHLFRKTKQES